MADPTRLRLVYLSGETTGETKTDRGESPGAGLWAVAMSAGIILAVSIPLGVILLAVFWPEGNSRNESRNSVTAILDRIAREDRARKGKYRDRHRD